MNRRGAVPTIKLSNFKREKVERLVTPMVLEDDPAIER
jgi:hypothetical protein